MQTHRKVVPVDNHIVRTALIAIALTAVALTSGCMVVESVGRFLGRGSRGAVFGRNPDNPFPDIKTVAVVPFVLGQTSIPVPPDRSFSFAQAFASELAQCKGFTVVRAYEIPYRQKLQSEGINLMRVSSAEDVAEIGRTIQADAVIICKVTDYDPYKPPRLGVELQFFKTADYANINKRYTDLSALAQSGGPVVVRGDETDSVFIIRFEKIYDARHDLTRNSLEMYAFARSGDKSPHWLEQYQLENNYIRFVSNQLIRKMISLGKKDAADKLQPGDR